MLKRSYTTTMLAGALALAGCQDLVVENTNQPDRRRALSQPDAVEVLVASTFPVFYNRLMRGTAGYIPLPMTGDMVTNSDNTSGGRDISTLPRLPFNNDPVTDSHALAALYWEDLYEVLANASDVLKVIDDGLVIETGSPAEDNTHRTKVFAKLAQAMATGYLGLLYDKGYIVDETVPDQYLEDPVHFMQLEPYTDLIAKSISLFEQAIDWAQDADFLIPRDWMYAVNDLTRDDIVQIAYAYMARISVLAARTPEERAAVNWNKVLEYTAQVTKDPLVLELTNASGRPASWLQYLQHSTSSRRLYASNHVVGLADISGNYQAWLAAPAETRTRFLITTPDKRITGATPTANGTYFRYVAQDVTNAVYGTYRQSYYQWFRRGGTYQSGDPYAMISLSEMRLLRAEALLRTNQLQQAADLISLTRVANGDLPAVTAAGVPQAVDCVPRTATGACGSLLDALKYERLIEVGYTDPTFGYADRRGFGTLTTGTMLHIPIPRAQQEILGLPYYTFGGSGPGSAQ